MHISFIIHFVLAFVLRLSSVFTHHSLFISAYKIPFNGRSLYAYRSDCAHHSLCVHSPFIHNSSRKVECFRDCTAFMSVFCGCMFLQLVHFLSHFQSIDIKKKQCLNFESFESSHHPVQKVNIQKLLECIYNQTVIWTLAGMNSIFMYIAHTTYQNYFPVGWKVEENHTQQLALHLWGPAFFCLFTYMMHRKKIYITI